MSETNSDQAQRADLLRMTAEVVASYLGNNNVDSSNLPNVIETVYKSLSDINQNHARWVGIGSSCFIHPA